MGVCLVVLVCAARPAGATTRAMADKRALYGDATLVPTRAGERAREELALAGSVAAAVRARAAVGALAVEVRLPAGEDPGAIVVAGEVALAAASVVRIAEGVVGPWSVGRVQVELGPGRADEPGPGPGPGWALGLALLGLGASLGVALDRGIARWRRPGGVGGRGRRLYAAGR